MPTMLTEQWKPFIDEQWDLPTDSGTTLTSSTSPLLKDAKQASQFGLITAVMGGINSAIGSFYQAKSMQFQLQSQASSYQFQSDMAALNARGAEIDAQSILEAGKSEKANYTMRAGQEKAATTADTAARGVVLGVGSSRDVAASQDIVKEIDVMTINSNATRAAWAKRTQATNYRNQALLLNTSAANALRSSRSISPFMSLSTSLLGSASQIGTQWLASRDTRD